ncbi:transcription elongation factor SPT6 [Vairimorpha necatrix]|uniref:Transcription elongation factor SPT6 n=1 Tax=Vairimorpha necatrix TaxID=6039 RepID=A0AAX4JB54_9MICR
MSDSTDEEIIKRRRKPSTHKKHKNLQNLFDDDSSVSSLEYVPEDTKQNNLFFELFGTGEEYFYIFQEKKPEEKIEPKQETNIEDLVSYIKNRHNYSDIESICELYLSGYNMNYIFFYKTDNIDFYEYLDIIQDIKFFISKSSGKFNKEIFNIFFDRIYNGKISLCEGEKLVSITKDKSVIKGVILDHLGNLVDKFNSYDNKIESFLDELNPKYVLVSGYNNSVKALVQLLIKYRIFYMESKYFPNFNIYEKLVQVGKLGLFPEITFIKLYRNIHFRTKNDEEDQTLKYDDLCYKEYQNNEEMANTIKTAISSVIAVAKINLKFLFQSENKLEILDFLGLKNCTRIFEKDSYENEEEIKKILKDEILYKNFMTFFSLHTKHSTTFKGFTDSFIFKELINIKINSVKDLINKEVEGTIFLVDEFYILVNILNNITCYVRTTDKYYLNQIVKIKIIEINEAFLSFTGEITNNNKSVQKIVKHPLLYNLNSKESEKKLLENEKIFILRQSNKDGKIIIVLKMYEDIIIHIKIEEYDNLDEIVNKKVKSILRNVANIKKHKNFYKNEEEAVNEISRESEFIKYGFYLTKDYPGKLCFIYNGKGVCKEYLSIEKMIKYKGKEFNTLEEFVEYRKKM